MTESFTHRTLSRRAVLGGAAAAGVAALAGCSAAEEAPTELVQRNADAVTLPSYIPFTEAEPDLPGTADGVPPAFFNYPEPIDRGGFPLPEMESFSLLLQANPPTEAAATNPVYQKVFESVGTSFEIIHGTSADYKDKFQVTMASGDIPDFVQIINVPQKPQLLERYFTDLTEVLGGDAIEEYPGLANIPSPAWRLPVVDGRLWGISKPSPPSARVMTTRGDLVEAKGVDRYPDLNSGEDFVDLLAELTNPAANEFALGASPTGWLLPAVVEMMGAPNQWRKNDDGTFTHQFMTPEYIQALDESAKIIAAGYLHPESFANPGQNSAWFTSGVTSLYMQSFVGWGGHARQHPDWNVGEAKLPKWEGGGKSSMHRSGGGYAAFVAIKKQADEGRLRELLTFADYIASPFGTNQFLELTYGVEGYSFEWVDGNPVLLDQASKKLVQGVTYVGGNGNAALFTPGQEESLRAQHDYLNTYLPQGTNNDALGLYSETELGDSATWSTRIGDLQRQILQSQQPASAWEAFAQEWNAGVGQKMAEEYAEAAAAAAGA